MNVDLSVLQTLHSDDDRCEIEIEDVGSFSCDRNGIVRDHGKFEGEDILVPYYWSLASQGFADAEVYGGICYYFFNLNEDEEQAIERLGKEFVLYETDNGFVYHSSNSTEMGFEEWVEYFQSLFEEGEEE